MRACVTPQPSRIGKSVRAAFPVPPRGTTYQPRVKPWVSQTDDPRVLKERRIWLDGECVPVQPPKPSRIGKSVRVAFPVPPRGTTYQPRVKPWVSQADDPRVLKERRISFDGECVPVQPPKPSRIGKSVRVEFPVLAPVIFNPPDAGQN